MLMIAYQAREASQDCRRRITDELKLVLNKGGFNFKGFTCSGENPTENLSEDGLSIGEGGLKWFPKEDFIRFNIHNLNFSPKRMGRKSQDTSGIIPDGLTRKDCVRVAEIFDPLGRVTPLTTSMKLDICKLIL